MDQFKFDVDMVLYKQDLTNKKKYKGCETFKRIYRELQEQVRLIQEHLDEMRLNLLTFRQLRAQQKGLTAATIQKFHQFPADESLVGERCSV